MGGDQLRRVPPQNIEAEQSVLGAVLLDNAALDIAAELVRPVDFYRETHRNILVAMLAIAEKGQGVDAITLCDALRISGQLEACGGASYIADLAATVPTASNAGHYARIVRERARLRMLIQAASEAIEGAFDVPADVDGFLDDAERRIFSAVTEHVSGGAREMTELVPGAVHDLEQLYEGKRGVTGLATGLVELDTLTAGFQPGELIVIAGRPSMGKSALAANIAVNAACAAEPVRAALFSLEMTAKSLTLRMLCAEARVDMGKARRGYLGARDFESLARAAAMLHRAPISLDDSSMLSPLEMKARCRRIARMPGAPLGLIIVDYLQLMRAAQAQQKREEEIAQISRSLKALAKELQVPVVALSQLNRQVETRSERRPLLADLRESGAIEQDADVVMFIYRDEVYHRDSKDAGTAEIIVAKQRNGPIGTVRVAFLKEYTQFANLADVNQDSLRTETL